MVEAVETLRPCLKLRLLVQRNELAEGGIHVRVMRAVELIGPRISIMSRGIKRKRRRIQPYQPIRGVGIRTSDEIRPVIIDTG